MSESMLEHAQGLFEAELYDDVKIICDLLIGLSESNLFECEPKDKYLIYFLYGESAFKLREYKLAESLFNKALQINKSNLRPKPKSQTSMVIYQSYTPKSL